MFYKGPLPPPTPDLTWNTPAQNGTGWALGIFSSPVPSKPSRNERARVAPTHRIALQMTDTGSRRSSRFRPYELRSLL
ncbi:hypothetical protein PsYK624_061110 [Phanerochaete sordida]|uniref:Uncharacterized protein n=1 Tax=Phanerochaete sordida TaxID=48140 RepID=A0A9P3G670_9APHY|nr:hypothetical protein PsYK624_061110 [Phanerochaete sordida]